MKFSVFFLSGVTKSQNITNFFVHVVKVLFFEIGLGLTRDFGCIMTSKRRSFATNNFQKKSAPSIFVQNRHRNRFPHSKWSQTFDLMMKSVAPELFSRSSPKKDPRNIFFEKWKSAGQNEEVLTPFRKK